MKTTGTSFNKDYLSGTTTGIKYQKKVLSKDAFSKVIMELDQNSYKVGYDKDGFT